MLKAQTQIAADRGLHSPARGVRVDVAMLGVTSFLALAYWQIAAALLLPACCCSATDPGCDDGHVANRILTCPAGAISHVVGSRLGPTGNHRN